MSKQLHKNFTDGQVKLLFEKYSKDGFRTDWSGPVTERMLGILKKAN